MMLVDGARPNYLKVYAIIDTSKVFNRLNSRPITFQALRTDLLYDQRMSQTFPQNPYTPQFVIANLVHALSAFQGSKFVGKE